jgi:ABC-type multidrug transport system ATPase subunit
MHQRFRGEVAYNAEVDVHFPHLTVGQTLTFAAKLRTPHRRVDNAPRKQVVNSIVKILGIVFGLSHTFNTKVGVSLFDDRAKRRMTLSGESVGEKGKGFLLQRL